MSYCRPSEGDIYMYPTGEKTAECQMCTFMPMHDEDGMFTWWGTFRAETREEAFWHVVSHIENGDACGSAIHRLFAEATAALQVG